MLGLVAYLVTDFQSQVKNMFLLQLFVISLEVLAPLVYHTSTNNKLPNPQKFVG
jgi:hypothetical protein